jgi:hypothetical protein
MPVCLSGPLGGTALMTFEPIFTVFNFSWLPQQQRDIRVTQNCVSLFPEFRCLTNTLNHAVDAAGCMC